MASIESKNLLVWVKAMSRGQALPLDASEIYDSLSAAETYASSAIAYGGQTIKALLEDGKYHSYVIQPSEGGYVLEEVGAIKSSDLKQYVQLVTTLPASAQEEGVIYICENIGYIWTGSEWKEVFRDVQSALTEINKDIEQLGKDLDLKAPLANPAFTGTVTVDGNEIALKTYVDGLFAQLVNSAPGVVDSATPLPSADYKAGQTFRVAEAGTYAGNTCETGDLIIVVSDYVEGTASDADFLVVQANIDGAVTSGADASTDGNIVVFDGVTGKIIKDSAVSIASLNTAIAKAHEHANKDALDTYDKTQTELLEAAATEAQSKVDAYKTTVDEALALKADKTEIPDAYTKTEMDGKLQVITENLNTKVTGTEVDDKIADAKEELTTSFENTLSERVGEIPEDTDIKTYIDNAVGSGGTSSAQAIAQAKQEAITTSNSYTDTQIANALTVTEF